LQKQYGGNVTRVLDRFSLSFKNRHGVKEGDWYPLGASRQHVWSVKSDYPGGSKFNDPVMPGLSVVLSIRDGSPILTIRYLPWGTPGSEIYQAWEQEIRKLGGIIHDETKIPVEFEKNPHHDEDFGG
jgi:hypothetical protein